jgi:hypothetical protein
MSWLDCLDRALAAKKIKGKKADEARVRYENLRREAIEDGMDVRAAEDWAAQQATQAVEVSKAEQKKRQLAQMRWSIDNWNTLKKGGATKLKVNTRALIEYQPEATPGIMSLNDRTDRNRGLLHKSLAGFIEKYSPKLVGLRNPKAGLENLVREIKKPGSTGDAMAASLAKAWKDATDLGVRMFNYAGGTLSHLDEWGLPQHQSRIKLYKIGETAWVRDHMGWVDWEKMRFPDGSRIPIAERERVLKEVYKTLKTGGGYRVKPGSGGGRASVGNKSEQHRFLVFKDGDAWLAMHKKYGEGSIYDTMMQHLDAMAHDIAMVQTFGPSPSVGKDQIGSHVRKIAADADVARQTPPRSMGVPTTFVDEGQGAINWLDDAFQIITRANKAPENGASAIAAGFFGELRSIGTSALLGSSVLLAVPGDFMTAAMRRSITKLPLFDTMRWYFRFMRPGNQADRELMMRAGFINDAQTRLSFAHARMTGLEAGGSRFARRLSDVTMRGSVLNWHTQSGRWATSAEFMGALADWKDMSFDRIPLKRVFEAHGITAADWDAMRQVPVYTTQEGHRFLMPDDYIRHSGLPEDEAYALADKFMVMIQQEAKLGTLDAQISPIVTLRGATRSGTLIGEIANSGAMFKNFPVTMFNTHIRQGLNMPTRIGKLGYLGGLFFGLTLAGAVGLQMREMAKGRDPLDMTDPKFWGRAALAGGGMSIVGDYLFNNVNTGFGGLGDVIAGPIVQFGSDVRELTIGNALQWMEGKDTKFGREAVRLAQHWAPGTTIWYLRAALQHWVWDNLIRLTDPRAEQSFRREASRLRKTTGQKHWWNPGAMMPARAPDLTQIVQ